MSKLPADSRFADIDNFPLNKLCEADIDLMIEAAGGSRIVPSGKPSESNADYIISDDVVELKLFEEEGLEKSDRQRKLAELFGKNQPDRPVVIIDPDQLDEESRRKYYNYLEGPFKSHIRKAVKQLTSTSALSNNCGARIFLAINNGYMSLSHEEFSDRVVKCARNNTSQIDVVVTAGCYFYSDGGEYQLLAPFVCHQINANVESSCTTALKASWDEFVTNKLTATIRGEEQLSRLKPPIQDIVFDLDGIRYVKPAIAIGGESSWYPKGRPRKRADLDRCPPVARVFPGLNKESWHRLSALRRDGTWHSSYAEYQELTHVSLSEPCEGARPIVKIDVNPDDYLNWLGREFVSFKSLAEYACILCDNLVREIALDCRLCSDSEVRPAKYVLLRVMQIGQDESLDMCSLYLQSTMAGLEYVTPIAEHLNIILNHGKALAAAYAIKHQISMVYYEVDKTYCWQ